MSLQKVLYSQHKDMQENNKFRRNKTTNNSDLKKTIKSAFEKRILSITYKNINAECLLLEVFLKETLKSLLREVVSFLKINIAFKFNIELHTIYTKPNVKEFDYNWLQPRIFKTVPQEGFSTDDFVEQFYIQVKKLKQKTAEFQAKEGGWTLLQLVKVEFKLSKYQPLKGAAYISLPQNIVNKRACVNVQNNDEFCFKWAIISALNCEVRQAHRPSAYNIEDIESEIIKIKNFRLNFRGLNFPLQIEDIAIFVKNNPSISMNVFGYDENTDLIIGPYYKTKRVKPTHVNLLYVERKIQNKIVGHFAWIRNMSRLLSRQITHHLQKVTICNGCLQHFLKDHYEKHLPSCGRKLKDVLSNERCALKYKNSVKIVDVPFVVYAKSKSFPQKNETGNPLSYIFMYFIKCNYDDDLNKWRIFKGPNAPRQFAESLIEDAKFYFENHAVITKPKLPLTDDEKIEYQNNYNCCLCSKAIPQDAKVKLHCRLTGKYKGPAHHTCALNYRIPKKFPVVFQNLTFDDSLLLIKQLNDIDDEPINVRTANNDSYISFEKDIQIGCGKLELRFLNFSMFLSCGLESLVEDMSLTDFKTLKSTYPDSNKFNMIFSKIVFPYHYLHSVEQLAENCLPNIDNFYDVIVNEECLVENYEQAQKLWSEFECKTLEDYLRVCLEIDILLLTDAFENFRSVCRDAYNLDPCHYYNAADFSWDALLKISDVSLSLPPHKEMHAFLERGMRGGISKCLQGQSLANNKYLCDYDDKLPSKYIICFHANDLYSRLMTEYLPEGDFEWETDVNISVNSIPNDSHIGYILEVDLEYPQSTLESHEAFPFCIETGVQKSAEGVFSVTNYVIYYKNLQQCLKHGLKLTKIHRILKFKQSDWLKRYIILNKTSKDNTNSFQINVLKLMNTAVYEKIMEKSVKKIKIRDKWESDGNKFGARTFVIKPGYNSFNIIDENLVGVEFYTNVYNHAPVYLEFIISELVKLNMYKFHYEYIMVKYEKVNVQLNYIDTDSLIYTIATDDLYKDIKNDILLMINPIACHNFRPLLKTLGIMKDANDGVLLKEFIGFRSKLYTLKTEDMRDKNKDCALKTDNILNSISLSDYTNLLYKNEIYCASIYSFKLKLYHRYATLLENVLPLRYLSDTNNILCSQIIEKFSSSYYQKSVCKSDFDEDDIMEID